MGKVSGEGFIQIDSLCQLWQSFEKNVLKLHICVRLSIATENLSHALTPLQKNRMHVLQICCFNHHSNLQSRMNCGPDGAELHHTTLLQCLGEVTAASTSASSAASWHCGVEWSPHSPDPSPLDFFHRVVLRLKRTHVREPLTVIEFKIAIAIRQGIAEISTDQCRRTVDHYRHFRFLSFFTHFFKVPPKLVK